MNKEERIVNGYYQTNIKTSRKEDSVYAMKYASQQLLIDKLQNNWNELKEYCRKYRYDSILDKMQEIESRK